MLVHFHVRYMFFSLSCLTFSNLILSSTLITILYIYVCTYIFKRREKMENILYDTGQCIKINIFFLHIFLSINIQHHHFSVGVNFDLYYIIFVNFSLQHIFFDHFYLSCVSVCVAVYTHNLKKVNLTIYKNKKMRKKKWTHTHTPERRSKVKKNLFKFLFVLYVCFARE